MGFQEIVHGETGGLLAGFVDEQESAVGRDLGIHRGHTVDVVLQLLSMSLEGLLRFFALLDFALEGIVDGLKFSRAIPHTLFRVRFAEPWLFLLAINRHVDWI